MKIIFRKSFERDLKRIKDRSIMQQVKQVIEQVEAAASLYGVNGAKKLSSVGSFYRFWIGEYRIGIAVEGAEVESRIYTVSSSPRDLPVLSIVPRVCEKQLVPDRKPLKPTLSRVGTAHPWQQTGQVGRAHLPNYY